VTQAVGLKAGEWCYAAGQRALYLGERGGQARVSINGSERLVNPEEISTSGPDGRNPADLGGTRDTSDPFQQLVDAAQKVREGLGRDKNSAESRAATRRSQIRLLDRALDILTSAPPKTRKTRQWSPEQREAASRRMRAMNAAKAEATA